jgi:hypothetical protein
MQRDRDVWLRRIKAVGLEHAAARLAADRLVVAAEHDPSVLTRDIELKDVRRMAARLDGTYVVRMFAEFETALRHYWAAGRRTGPPARTRDLIDGVAATCTVLADRLRNAHQVREYRNYLVHERDRLTVPLSILDARGHLCRFVSHLPPNW